MSSTFFTATPHWHYLIVAYFFLGGLAGGSYFLATMMDLFGKSEDRPLVRLAYLIAFPAVCVCGLLLTVDLGRPERFWHMLVQARPSGRWSRRTLRCRSGHGRCFCSAGAPSCRSSRCWPSGAGLAGRVFAGSP